MDPMQVMPMAPEVENLDQQQAQLKPHHLSIMLNNYKIH